MKIKKLTGSAFLKYASLGPEVMTNKTRANGLLLVKVKGINFAIPLRSNLPHNNFTAFLTFSNPKVKGKFKGLHYEKALIVSESDFSKESFRINADEYYKIKKNEEKITRNLERYINYYIDNYRNEHNKKKLNLTLSTLQYFHDELGLVNAID